MSDVFRDRRWIFLPDDADYWSITDRAATRMHAALMRQENQIVTDIVGDATGGSRFPRDSLQDLKDAFDEYDLEPSIVYYYAWEIINPGGRMDTRVAILVGFPGSQIGQQISIDASGSNKLVVDGLIAEAGRLIDKIKNEITPDTNAAPISPARKAALERKLAEVSASRADAAPEAAAAPVEPLPETSVKDNWRAWLARTWRDHTARLVVTITAGVVTALILVWLGVTQL